VGPWCPGRGVPVGVHSNSCSNSNRIPVRSPSRFRSEFHVEFLNEVHPDSMSMSCPEPVPACPACPGVPVSRCPGVPASRCPGVPVSRCPGVPASRRPGVPVSRVSRCPGVPHTFGVLHQLVSVNQTHIRRPCCSDSSDSSATSFVCFFVCFAGS